MRRPFCGPVLRTLADTVTRPDPPGPPLPHAPGLALGGPSLSGSRAGADLAAVASCRRGRNDKGPRVAAP